MKIEKRVGIDIQKAALSETVLRETALKFAHESSLSFLNTGF